MTAEERIATLVLLGCAFWRRVGTYDPSVRYIVPPDGKALRYGRVNSYLHEWDYSDYPRRDTTEIPFEPRLIGFIPETLFMQFVRNLTR